MKLNYEQLKQYYTALTMGLKAECHLVTELVGGMPGDEEGVRAFVVHQMKLPAKDVEQAVQQILAHEVASARITPPEGELEETVDKGVNLIRRDKHGPWLGDWMVKACLKAAASRIGLFKTKIGTKGDMAELGTVIPTGVSAVGETELERRRIYLRDASGKKPAQTSLRFFRGKVSSPQGSKSIVNLAEVCAPGSRFEFEFRFAEGKVTEEDAARLCAVAMTVGLGSCKAFEMGKFAIDELEVERKKPMPKKMTAAA